MPWAVATHPDFDSEFDALDQEVQDELIGRLQVLAEYGPGLGRPQVDTLKGSSFPNMKEFRFRHDGLWRFAFAFEPQQRAIVLVGGDKEGENQKRFYKDLIRVADRRFAAHVQSLKAAKGEQVMRSLEQIISNLPPDRRAKVTARGQKLIAEEMALRHLRQARDFTQQKMANLLDIDQAGVSKIEKRSDMLISTMRSYVEAMGGSLRLVATFPDGCVELSTLGDVAASSGPKSKGTTKRNRRLGLAHTTEQTP